jgi:hypothetical protein
MLGHHSFHSHRDLNILSRILDPFGELFNLAFVGELLPLLFKHIVRLIQSEYIGVPMVKMTKHEAKGKLLQCVSTYSITASLREMLLEGFNETELGVHVCEHNYKEYGGLMKAWYSDYKPDHWVKSMNHHHVPYLRAYLSSFVEEVKQLKKEGTLIQAHGSRQVFIIDKGLRRGFPDLPTFLSMKLDFGDVSMISKEEMYQIPLGLEIPHHDRRLKVK